MMNDEDKKKLAAAKVALVAEAAAKGKNETTEAPEAPETPVEAKAEESPAKTTKAGKNSAKAQREAEEEAEKEDRKEKIAAGEIDASTDADGNAPAVKKGPAPKTRPRAERHGKGYRKGAKLIVKDAYELSEAMEILPKTSSVKFDASVELHINLNVDPRQADQNIRGNVALPHGTGKTVRVAVFAPEDAHAAAKKAGADIIGEATIIDALKKEQIDFDVLIATPALMAQLGRYAKLLGPRGLMPNPKSGTVTNDVAKAVASAKAGQVEFRVDKQSIIHLAIGKASFTPTQLTENAKSVIDAIQSSRPNSIKGGFIMKITTTTSMGPSIRIAHNDSRVDS